MQWWSVWYPGAEPGGGSYVAQRMLAARSERDALAGTLLFNVSTINALITVLNADARVGDGWRPDALGSICFLVASTLAIVATLDRHTLWDKRARTWHGTWLNMIGSVFFGISAVGAYVIPDSGDLVSLFWADLGTFLGALCFLAAALLSRRSIRVDGTSARSATSEAA